MLIGTSTAPNTFTESIVKEMAAYTHRPIILPLSNPTYLAEAKPSDLITWTDGRALVATGSPFNPFTHKGVTYVIGQANNALLYPGLGLGTIVARAKHISDSMIAAAAKALADLVDVHVRNAAFNIAYRALGYIFKVGVTVNIPITLASTDRKYNDDKRNSKEATGL